MPAAKAKHKPKVAPVRKRQRAKQGPQARTPSAQAIAEVQTLTRKQRLFVHYYLETGGKGTEAARRAGYAFPNVACANLLQTLSVASAIASHAESALSSEEILNELADMASYDLTDCCDPETGLPDIKRIYQAGKLHLVHSLTPGPNGVAVKLYNRKEALELLGKYRKLWVERISLEDFDPSKLSVEQLQAIVAKGRS